MQVVCFCVVCLFRWKMDIIYISLCLQEYFYCMINDNHNDNVHVPTRLHVETLFGHVTKPYSLYIISISWHFIIVSNYQELTSVARIE